MNIYNIEIEQILKIKKTESNRLNTIVGITSIIGLTLMIYSLIHFTKSSIYLLIAGTIISILGLIYGNKRKNELYNFIEYELAKNFDNIKFYIYKKKSLLSKNEYNFYNSLKNIADELGYTVLTKIRIADIVEVQNTNKREWNKHFYKISNKHVDFALVSSNSLEIILLIELDDNSHNYMQKDRDDFVNELYKAVGYKLLRVRGTEKLKEKILESINTNKE